VTDAAGTVRDYFDDFKAILHVSAFRKVVEQVRNSSACSSSPRAPGIIGL
jgi:hypothetical protein